MIKQSLLLISIILLATFLRLYGLNWDAGFHLHPDERAIVMFTLPLHLPGSNTEFLSPASQWNPHFFAYGSFPLYLLKAASNLLSMAYPSLATYDHIQLVGRIISALADMGTVLLIYLFGKKLFSKKIGLIAAFFYSISVFPIQAAHFYAVDSLLTFFIAVTLYQLVNFYHSPSFRFALCVGIFFGLSLATKISAVVLISAIGLALAADFLLLFLQTPHKPHIWFPHIPVFLRHLIFKGGIITATTLVTFLVFEPYALIDFPTFLLHNTQQSQMTHDAFIFPYTLQYVGKLPYIYELKNVFLWGQGPVIAFLTFTGTLYVTYLTLRKEKVGKWPYEVIILTFFWAYFFVVGKFAVGWMRYMLPLYPLLCLFAAVLFEKLLNIFPSKLYVIRYLLYAYLLFAIIWPLSFLSIYTKPPTRVTASEWINKNIPAGKTLALEHWDDSLPLFGQQNYRIETLELYNPDTKEKWETINRQLAISDYIILASNRLYIPLSKLTDCDILPPGRCYKQTANYYKNLFSGKLGFTKIAEFEVFPTIPFSNIQIDDSSADESFTVYDHPKILIFKKNEF